MAEFSHVSVLLNETIESLDIKPDGIYVDGTLGGGGHSSEILKRLGKGGMLIGIDRDNDAIEAASKKLGEVETEGKFTIIHDNYVNMVEICKNLGIEKVDGILLDIGVSSHQFDEAERGFSYRMDGPLDMRMNREDKLTASDIVNNYSEKEISDILFTYGEEKWSKRIAQFIVEARKKKPIETTFELVDIINAAVPKSARDADGNKKRVFQALRVAVNFELDVLSDVIEGAIDMLNPGGRMAIITFQSLEDAIVKKLYRQAENPCTCPPNLPCVCGKLPKGKMLNRVGILPGKEEIERNPRSRSAKLRVFVKKEE